jgi:tetratricopeptide (TPR) repeat protein
MASNLLLFKTTGNSRPEIVIETGSNGFDTNLARKISHKHEIYGEKSKPKDFLSYRTDNHKYLSIFITKSDNNESYFLVFILERTESIEPFSIMINDMRQLIKMSMKKSKSTLEDSLNHILNQRNNLEQDVNDVKRLQERIVNKANELLDEKNFDETQEMIKRANEIPPKIAYLCKRGDEAFYNDKNYRQAQRHYKDASNFAKKINQTPIVKLLEHKAKRAETIPQFKKNWGITYDKIVKPLKKIEKRDYSFYLKPIKLIDQAIEISDYLEDDKTIGDLQKLADYLERANSLSEELDSIDAKITDVLKQIKK